MKKTIAISPSPTPRAKTSMDVNFPGSLNYYKVNTNTVSRKSVADLICHIHLFPDLSFAHTHTHTPK